MTLPEVIRASSGAPIRQRCWVEGTRIQWCPRRLTWVFGNMFVKDILATDRYLGGSVHGIVIDPPMGSSHGQGCITPETIVADDWEVSP